ncbi:hypothetical protein T265_12974 [Opisthorchis viverrini]|uniref:SEC7 domain-containing protein n=1 Tax=Opisthorchis viverrini TaxID=6198 RepID=A0A074ZW88_OPIVI|nr:hypothetical protein T265_12974 [Opisthorchis viverrini]KER31396.1 hypothetical protein T265_12974 [Opisthorchis viverrini]
MAPSNALSIVQSEISLLSTALKCNARISFRGYQEEMKSPVYKNFVQLRSILNSVSSLNEVEPLVYLTPFLEVIRAEDVTGPITGLALTAVDKFLSYGLLEVPSTDSAEWFATHGPRSFRSVSMAVEAIADFGTQARFVGTDRSSDEVVLMKVLHLLRTLLLVPAGAFVSDRAVREILQSCFRICFESKLSELLRRTAELCLASIVQLFFSRLPSILWSSQKQWVVTTNEHSEPSQVADHAVVPTHQNVDTVPDKSSESLDVPPKCDQTNTSNTSDIGVATANEPVNPSVEEQNTLEVHTEEATQETCEAIAQNDMEGSRKTETTLPPANQTEVGNPTPQPYGLPAVYDLLHYLISLLSPDHNSDAIISVALGLIAIALETGADAIASSPSLLRLVQGDLTKNLLLLLYSDRVWLFAATLRVCFMLFESMRKHLKLQLEVYLQRLIAISSPDNESTGYERREVALDSVVRIFLVPGMATELYVNYDCDPYCSNLFEDITKMLAKNAYPVERLMSTHFLALDALLAVLSTIGTNCTSPDSGRRACSPQLGESENLEPAKPSFEQESASFRDHPAGGVKVRLNRHPTDPSLLPSREKLNAAKATKKILILGSDQFNISPKAGIAFLQKNGLLRTPLDPDELAHFLRENPRLDKRMIGEYLSDRKNSDVLAAYVRQFNFAGVQIDEALRAYLEAFRLPGEAPLIQRLVEHFAEHWFVANNAPFVDVDSAFTLAYAILMLNTDQHNPNSKKQNVPMTLTDFKKNLSGMNGTGDFAPKLLEEIFTNIQKNEIVMPSEQLGLVRENYLWKCLLRRAATSQANFVHVQTGTLDADLFDLIWGPTVSALSFIFDKTIDPAVQNKVVHGFIRCAAIAAHHGMSDVLDNLPPTGLPVYIGRNAKGRLALRLVFALTSSHADILRYGWHSLLDCLLQLFRAGLLPDELTESEDFLAPSRRVRLTTKGCIPIPDVKTGKLGRNATGTEQSGRELSVLTSFYQYLTSGSGWIGSDREDEPDEPAQTTQQKAHSESSCVDVKHVSNTDFLMDDQLGFGYWMDAPASAQLDEHRAARVALDTVRQCEIVQLVKDSKFLVDASLAELIKALLRAIRGDDCAVVHASNSNLFFEPTASTHCDGEPGISHAHSISTLSKPADANSQSVPGGTEDAIIVPSPPPVEHSLRRSMTLPSSTSYYPAFCATGDTPSEDCRIFCLELLIRILLYNRDRVSNLWPFTQCYLADVLLTAAEPSPLTERVIVGFLRLAICLLRRHEMTCQIFACLHYILLTRGDHLLLDCYQAVAGTATAVDRSKPVAGQYRNQSKNTVGLQIIAGLTHLLRNHATDLPDPASDWQLIFSLIDVCGAGLRAAPLASHRHNSSRQTHYSSMHDIASARVPLSSPHVSRGYTSDSEATDYCTSFPSDSVPAAQPTGEEKQTEKRAVSLSSSTVPQSKRRFDNAAAAWVIVDVEPRQSVELSTAEPAGVRMMHDASVHSPTALPHSVKTHHLVPSHLLGLHITIGSRDPVTMKQAADCLDFLIRDPTFITPDNFEYCVRTLRVFVEACLRRSSSLTLERASPVIAPNHTPKRPNRSGFGRKTTGFMAGLRSTGSESGSDSDEDGKERRNRNAELAKEVFLSPTTGVIAIQLLDLIHLLLTRVSSIYTEWTRSPLPETMGTEDAPKTAEACDEQQPEVDTEFLWSNCWRPLLQAIGRLCCDCRKDVRTDALAYLQRAILSPILQSLSGKQWEDCFDKVIFPLLSGFLESIALDEAVAAQADSSNTTGRNSARSSSSVHFNTVEFVDPRMRAIPLLTKVFLQHLRPLHDLANFHSLWSRILSYMEQYMQASSSDSLTDAVRESLKNVLLVMYTGTYDTPPILFRDTNQGSQATLWNLTEKHLSSFLPSLLDQLFPPPAPSPPETSKTDPAVCVTFPDGNAAATSPLSDVVESPHSPESAGRDEPVSVPPSAIPTPSHPIGRYPMDSPGTRLLKWLEREFTDRKVCGSNRTSASRIPLSRLGQPGNIPALVLPPVGMAAKHGEGATTERFFSVLYSLMMCHRSIISVLKVVRLPDANSAADTQSLSCC